MKKIAIEKAAARLERAREALYDIERSPDFSSFSKAWTDFLMRINSILSVLEKGAANNPASKQWYYSQKKRGRSDPLIKYMVQARNADEHGIEPVTAEVAGYLEIGAWGEPVHIEGMKHDGAGGVQMKVLPVNGRFPHIDVQNSHPKLIPVYDDRHGGVWYAPPEEHLGRKLDNTSPYAVASHMFSYVKAALEDATKLIE